jgi:PAS domain S-box-containing protein
MLVLGILAFLAGIVLVAKQMYARAQAENVKKRLELDRQDLAARLAALESYYPQALVMMDSRGLIRRVNGTAGRLFGYTESELLGQSIQRLLPLEPSALDTSATGITAVDGQGAAPIEVRCKDRSTVKVRITRSNMESQGRSDVYMFFEAMSFEKPDLEKAPGFEQSKSRATAVGREFATADQEAGSRP